MIEHFNGNRTVLQRQHDPYAVVVNNICVMLLRGCEHVLEVFGHNFIVAVEEGDVFTACFAYACVAGSTGAVIHWLLEYLHPVIVPVKLTAQIQAVIR